MHECACPAKVIERMKDMSQEWERFKGIQVLPGSDREDRPDEVVVAIYD
jgi:hypothetical protein